jgi:hypothetical protein
MTDVVGAVMRPANRLPPKDLKYFDRLLSITVRHEYYAAGSSGFGLCPDLVMVPTRETQVLLRNLGLLLRPRAAGVDILYNTGGAAAIIRHLWTQQDRRGSAPISPLDNPRVRYGSWSRLTFTFAISNPLFTNFTKTPSAIRPGADCVYLSNKAVEDDGALNLQWSKATALQEKTFSPAHVRISTDKYPNATQVLLLEPSGRCILSAEKDYAPPAAGSISQHESTESGLHRVGFEPGRDIHVDMSREAPGRYSYVIKPSPNVETSLIYAAAPESPLLLVDLFLADPEPRTALRGLYPIKLPQTRPGPDSGPDENAKAIALITPRDYEIRFAARKTIWTYYIVFPSGAGAASALTIEPQSANTPAFFGPNPVTLPTGRAAHQFKAKSSCALHARPTAVLQLRGALAGGPARILLDSLPLPSAESVRPSRDPKRPAASDVFVYL